MARAVFRQEKLEFKARLGLHSEILCSKGGRRGGGRKGREKREQKRREEKRREEEERGGEGIRREGESYLVLAANAEFFQ